jgi:hypothetical protein
VSDEKFIDVLYAACFVPLILKKLDLKFTEDEIKRMGLEHVAIETEANN